MQFLGATFYNISQIGHPELWERHLGCTTLWVQHSMWRTPRFSRHPSEQLKWMNRAWGPLMGGALRCDGHVVVFKVSRRRITLQITGIGWARAASGTNRSGEHQQKYY